jgi:hypothetical protein
LERHTLELGPGTNEMAHRMCGKAFDARLPVPACSHELGQGLGVVRIRLVALEGRRGSGVACLNADNRQTSGLEAVIEPGCQKPGLQSDAHEVGCVTAKSGGKRLRIARPLAPPDGAASLVKDVDRSLLV